MNVAQYRAYWNLWKPCAAYYRSQGLTKEQIDEKRAKVVEKRLGYPISMTTWKRWKNSEVDAAFAAFKAISSGDNLNAQLAAIDQPENRQHRVLQECKDLTADILGLGIDDPEHNRKLFNYLNALCLRIVFKKAEACTDAQLHKVKGVLQQRIRQLEKDLQAEAAKAANSEGEPF